MQEQTLSGYFPQEVTDKYTMHKIMVEQALTDIFALYPELQTLSVWHGLTPCDLVISSEVTVKYANHKINYT